MTDSPYKVEPFQPVDAEKVSHLFVEVYGDAYPIKTVYDPEKLIAAFESGNYFPFLVRTGSDRIVAYGALYRSAPYEGIYEFGQGIVSSDVRGAGIGRILFEYVAEYIQALPGSEVYFGEAVCNHTHTQKAGAMIKTIETGIEIDLMPAKIYEKDRTVTGRVAVLDMFRSFVSKPHTVHVPDTYEDIIRYIYSGFDDRRTIAVLTGNMPSDQPTEMSVKVFEFAGVARITVTKSGSDFEQVFTLNERSLLNQNIAVIQIWLKSSWPWIGEAVEVLRKNGYFFGGVFPRWFDVDGLLLQKVLGQPSWEGIRLYSDRAEKIYRFIHDDWEDVRKNPILKENIHHE
ncbi:MAG: GNAT family N-acetyltransferase [Proteobacteria bacterium]|nr:GNAT family N-acetyltransferase [Pseudomonadota bacterium]